MDTTPFVAHARATVDLQGVSVAPAIY
jgi:hypothetical protein